MQKTNTEIFVKIPTCHHCDASKVRCNQDYANASTAMPLEGCLHSNANSAMPLQ